MNNSNSKWLKECKSRRDSICDRLKTERIKSNVTLPSTERTTSACWKLCVNDAKSNFTMSKTTRTTSDCTNPCTKSDKSNKATSKIKRDALILVDLKMIKMKSNFMQLLGINGKSKVAWSHTKGRNSKWEKPFKDITSSSSAKSNRNMKSSRLRGPWHNMERSKRLELFEKRDISG